MEVIPHTIEGHPLHTITIEGHPLHTIEGHPLQAVVFMRAGTKTHWQNPARFDLSGDKDRGRSA